MKKKLFLAILSLSLCVAVKAQKNDTVYLKNGDRITGELKKLEFGLLYLKTDGMKTINIEYIKLNTVHSSKYFDIRATAGRRFFGSLSRSKDSATVIINTSSGQVALHFSDIVQIAPINARFLSKLDGNIGLGLNYTKASDVLQYNISTQVLYRTTNYLTTFDFNSIITNNQDTSITRNNNMGLSITEFYTGKWYTRVQAKAQQNTELDLQLRLQSGVAAGYDFIRKTAVRFNGTGGLLYNHEKGLDSTKISNNIEALLSLQYKWVQYQHPKADFTTGINYYPSLTIQNRHRVEFNLVAKIELIRDLYFNVQIYDLFDSKTIADGLEKNDYGIITSLNYTF